jgi:hypothetical protein|uniref:Uncharacterized protein n=1 Tax=viral metagenome TaxID=1070528 RepID=A0A6C0AHB9_9ZZZZ
MSTILFSDPAVLGKTKDGDVDDIACILLLAQIFGPRLIVVICGDRFELFMKAVGETLHAVYGCTFIQEEQLDLQLQDKNTVYVHAPTQVSSAEWMERNREHISQIYRQGDDQSVNFKSSPEMRAVLTHNVTLYHTDETNFTIDFDVQVDQHLDGLARKIYRDYFEFAYRKKFGLAIHSEVLCERLYNDRPGNGILEYLPLIEQFPTIVLPDRLEQALLNTIHTTDESALRNVRNIVGILNMYCDYEVLIVDDKLPHMGNLKSLEDVAKWSGCPDIVKAFFEKARMKSTPLFDFASGYWSTMGRCPREELQRAVVSSLKQLHYDMLD